MTQQSAFTAFVGQVERDREGHLWAVLYREGQIIAREQMRSLRRGRRRVTDMLLAAADPTPVLTRERPRHDAPGLGQHGAIRRVTDTSVGRGGLHSGGRWYPVHVV